MGFLRNIVNLTRNIKQLTYDQAQRNNLLLRALYHYNNTALQNLSYANLQYFIKNGYQKNVDVFSVINWIAEQASNVPLQVQRWDGEKWIEDKNNPLQKLIDRPNPYQDGVEQRAEVYTFYLTTGNAYEYAPRIEGGNSDGQALEKWVMPSQFTNIRTGGWMNPVAGYELDMFGSNPRFMPFKDVLHIRTPNLEYGEGQELYGMSPLRAGLLSLNRSNANSTASTNSFENMGMAGIISEKTDGMTGPLTDEQRQYEEDRIQSDYMGVFNQGKTMVTNADITYTKLGLSPVDLNLIEDKKATLRDFCNIYNVSSVLFNDNANSTYNNVLEAKKSAYTDAVMPLVERYIAKLSAWLVDSYGGSDKVRIIADTSDIAVLQDDKAEQAAWVTSLIDRGVISRGKGNEIMGFDVPDDPMMDVHTVSMGVIPLNEITYDPMIESEEAKKKLKDYGIE